MIGKLRGIVDEKAEDSLIVDVGGVGYHVFVSTRFLDSLLTGDSVILHVEMIVREDFIHLYGFPDSVEREWFRLLTTVQRLGNKMALSILGAYPPAQIANAILSKDISAFSRISGIGAKLAERIVVELKDKVLKMPSGDFVAASSSIDDGKKPSNNKKQPESDEKVVLDESISALANLGYSRSDAYSASAKAISAIKSSEKPIVVSEVIKLSLKELAKL